MSNSTRFGKFAFKGGLTINKDYLKQNIFKNLAHPKKTEPSQALNKKRNQLTIQSLNQTRNASKPKQDIKQICTTNPNENIKKNPNKKTFPNKMLYLNNLNTSIEPKERKNANLQNRTINVVLNTTSNESTEKPKNLSTQKNKNQPKRTNSEEDENNILRADKIIENIKTSFNILSKFEAKEEEKSKEHSLFHFPTFKDKTPNAQIPSEYFNEILSSFCIEENTLEFKIIPNFMQKQKEINTKMRAIIVNWIIEVHNRFKLLPDTLFLAVIIFDRYMSIINKIQKEKLQLVGVTSLLLACKYEEIFSPEIRDFVCILDKSYQKEDLMIMENYMMKILKFEVTFPSSLKYFDILRLEFQIEDSWYDVGTFLLELSLLDCRFSKYSQAAIATSVCFMICKFKGQSNDNFFDYISIPKDTILKCIMDICFLIEYIDQSEYTAVVKKHSESLNRIKKIFSDKKIS